MGPVPKGGGSRYWLTDRPLKAKNTAVADNFARMKEANYAAAGLASFDLLLLIFVAWRFLRVFCMWFAISAHIIIYVQQYFRHPLVWCCNDPQWSISSLLDVYSGIHGKLQWDTETERTHQTKCPIAHLLKSQDIDMPLLLWLIHNHNVWHSHLVTLVPIALY